MTEIGFYHLLTTPLERALPRLLERARAQGYRLVVRAASSERVEHLNALLWTYDEAGFLPHGSARDGDPAVPGGGGVMSGLLPSWRRWLRAWVRRGAWTRRSG